MGEKSRSVSRGEKDAKKKKKDKKNRNRSASKEKRRSQSKTSSGSRKSRIDSGISVSTNFSKESLSISPRDDRIPIQMEAESTENVEIEKIDKSSPKKEQSSEKSPKVKKEENLNDSKKTNSPSPSPPRRVLEVSQADTTIKDENEKEPNIPTEKDPKEDLHKTDNKVHLKVPEDLDPVEEDQDLEKEGGQDHEKGEQDPGIGIITDPEILKMKLMLREDGDEIIIMRGTGTDIAGDHITDTTMKVIMVITEEVVPLQLLLGKTRSTVS